jgi:hypothetical protein
MLKFFLLSLDIHLTFSIWILAFGLELTPFKPASDLLFPDLNPFVVLRITLFEVSQKTPYCFTPRGKDRQPDQDKKNAL